MALGFGLVFGLVWYGGLIAAFFAVRKAGRFPVRLDADRAAGELRIAERSLFGGEPKEDVLPLVRLAGLTVRLLRTTPQRAQAGAALGETGARVQLDFRLRGETGDESLATRGVTVAVEHLDKHEEVADFAYRLAAAAGLPFARVVRNDAREVEIELARAATPGFSVAPQELPVANYAQDAVAPAARAAVAQEKIPPFDPAGFKSDHRVEAWTPGVEVVFRKPMSFAALGCLPFATLVFAGPLVFVILGKQGEMDPTGRVVVSAFVGIFGLLIGAAAVGAVGSAMPRSLRFDWSSRAITIRTLLHTTEIPMAEISTLELRSVHTVSRSKNSTTNYYHAELRAHRRTTAAAESNELLVRTESRREDPDTPYRQALPLATELAKAMGVERQVTDY